MGIKRRFAFICLFVIHCLFSLSSLHAEVWSLSRIQDRALEVSPFIKAQIQEKKVELFRYEGAALLSNPAVQVIPGYTSQSGSQGMSWDVTLLQVLPFPGKLSSQKKAQEYLLKISEVSESEGKLLIQHGATLAAVRVAMLHEISLHSLERKRRFRLIQDYLRTHPQPSPAQKIETALIENQMRLLEKGIYELTGELEVARSQLQFFLQTDTKVEPQFTWIKSPEIPDREELLSRLHLYNPGMLKRTMELERTMELFNRAKLDPWPDFTLGLNYRVENVNPSNTFYQFVLGVSIPLFDRGQYSIPAARARYDAEEYRKGLYSIQIEKDFNVAWARVQTTSRILKQFPLQLVHEAEQSFNQAEHEFKKNRINAATMLQTDSQIHETLDSIYQSQTNFLEQLSQVLLLVGLPLQWNMN